MPILLLSFSPQKLWLFALTLFLFGTSASTVSSPAAYDVSWSSPSNFSETHYTDGMPLGNGAVVVLAWANVTAGGLSFYVRHPHALHTDSQPFTLARVSINLSPNPFVIGAGYFNQTHHLSDGSMNIFAGGDDYASHAVALRIYVDANSDTIVVTVTSATVTPYSLAARIDSVRPMDAVLKYNQPFQCFETTSRPDVVGNPNDDSITLRHENCVSCGDTDLWSFSIAQQGLGAALPSPLPPSLLDGRVFGIGLFGDGLIPTANGTALASVTPATAFTILVSVRVENVATPSDWENSLATQVAEAKAMPPTLRAAASDAWWISFWNRSWISLPSDSSALAAQYARTRFIQAAQSRGTVQPIKFNGMLYNTASGSEGPINVDARDWGGDQWWQNVRSPYASMFASGDYDTLKPVLEWASAFLPLAKARTALLLPGVNGIFFTEMTNAFGMYNGQMFDTCNSSSRPPDYPKWLAVGGWVRWDFSGNALGPEAGIMAIDLMLHTGNMADAERFVPIATLTLDFIASFYKNRTADGKMLIWPAQALESWWCDWPGWVNCTQNDMPTIAAAYALIARLLALPPSASYLVTPAQRASYEALAAILPPLPRNGSVWVPGDVLSNVGPGHREVPELYAVHPFKLFTAGKASLDPSIDLTVGRATWNGSDNAKKNIGWYYGGIDAALLGMTNESWTMVLDRATNSPPEKGYRYPAFAPHLQDSEPSADHYANLMTALQTMLLQAGGDAANSLILFPAWPCNVDVSFKLWGALNTTVDVVFAGGKLVSLNVMPPERAAAVKWANCV